MLLGDAKRSGAEVVRIVLVVQGKILALHASEKDVSIVADGQWNLAIIATKAGFFHFIRKVPALKDRQDHLLVPLVFALEVFPRRGPIPLQDLQQLLLLLRSIPILTPLHVRVFRRLEAPFALFIRAHRRSMFADVGLAPIAAILEHESLVPHGGLESRNEKNYIHGALLVLVLPVLQLVVREDDDEKDRRRRRRRSKANPVPDRRLVQWVQQPQLAGHQQESVMHSSTSCLFRRLSPRPSKKSGRFFSSVATTRAG